ncbi:MAG: SpoIVB peptidase [Clostridia bacterium]|nr:SpoIVB peptidase [Clostridia bacterium]
MKKKLFFILLLFFLLIIYIYVMSIEVIPNSIVLMQGDNLNFATLWGINLHGFDEQKVMQASSEIENSRSNGVGKIDLSLNLFENIPLKDVSVSVVPKTKVIPLGNAIGLKLYTDGVLVVGMSEIDGEKPYANSDIREGDRIISINDKEIGTTDKLIETVNSSNGSELKVKYMRDNSELETSILPIRTSENEYKLGLWVRDAAAGVGTASFYVPSSGKFAALGHGISDADTGELITISNGELVTTNIVLIQKGEKGKPGEIKGSIEGGKKLGEISKNTKFGIVGNISNTGLMELTENEIDVANRNEVKIGKAKIICELEIGKKEYYDVEIQRVYTNNNKDNKSMLIKVTDERLIDKTGGIVQGMSGSPIIQDDKFVGAVTHVLVNDPLQGYGVFADMMLNQMM